MENSASLAYQPEEKPLLEKLAVCKNLPSAPGIAERILSLAEDRNATAEDFAELISIDAALSARILQLANSAIYKQRREVDDIRRAVALIGLEATLTNALSIAFVSSIRDHESSGLDKVLFWRRSIGAASSCRLLARHFHLPSGESYFMGALLQDIGMIALDSCDNSIYSKLGDRQADHIFVAKHECDTIGMDHATAGAWLMSSWGLPVKYCQSILASHKPGEIPVDPEHSRLANSVAVAGHIADIFFGHDTQTCVERALGTGALRIGLTPDILDAMLPRLVEELSALSSLFSLDLGTPEWLEKKQQEANSIIEADKDVAPAGT